MISLTAAKAAVKRSACFQTRGAAPRQARLRNDVLREAASTDQRLLVAREAARGEAARDGVPDGDMEDDFEPVAGIVRRRSGLGRAGLPKITEWTVASTA